MEGRWFDSLVGSLVVGKVENHHPHHHLHRYFHLEQEGCLFSVVAVKVLLAVSLEVLVCRFEWRRLLKIMMVRLVYILGDYIQLKNHLYCLIQSINFQYYHSLYQEKKNYFIKMRVREGGRGEMRMRR